MADARQQCEWDRTLSLLAFVGSMLGQNPPRPIDFIPPRYRPHAGQPAEPTPDDRRRRVEQNWRYLDAYFGQFKKKG